MPVESQQIEPYLERILLSAEFARSERMSRFLRFIVRESVSSTGVEIKERTIGVEVFDRPADWDPKIDTIVRTEARRLRKKLDVYYQTAGSSDSLRIEMPKGGYVPEFHLVDLSVAGLPVEAELPAKTAVAPAIALPPQARSRRKFLPLVILALAIAAFLMIIFSKSRDRNASETFREVPFATAFGQELSPAISPDGKSMAYVWDGDGNNLDIYVKPLDGSASVRFTADSAPDLNPAWSPDGKSMAILRCGNGQCDVLVKSWPGGSEHLITRIRSEMGNWTDSASPLLGNPGPDWTPDGKSLIVSDQKGQDETRLIQVSVATGDVREITRPAGIIHDFYPRVSPDGKQVAFVRYFSHGLGEIYVMPLDTLRPVQLTREGRTIAGLSWAPGGRNLIFASDRQGAFQLWKIDVSGGKPARLPSGTSSATDVAVARSGDWLAYVATAVNSNIWRARLTGVGSGTPERFIASSGRNHTPRYSPDGKRIVFVTDRSGSWEIWVCDASGANPRQLTHFHGPFLGGMSWSPDSKRIAFDARPSGHAAIFLMDVDGGEPRLVEKNAFEERVPFWSRDGNSLYFNSDRDGSSTVWKRSLTNNSVKKISRPNTFLSAEAMDGSALFYQERAGAIVRSGLDGRNAHNVSPEVIAWPTPNWAVGRHGIYYTHQDGQPGVGFYLYTGDRARLLWRSVRPMVIGTPSMSVSPDDEWMLFAQQDHSSSDIYIRRGSL